MINLTLVLVASARQVLILILWCFSGFLWFGGIVLCSVYRCTSGVCLVSKTCLLIVCLCLYRARQSIYNWSLCMGRGCLHSSHSQC